MKTIAVITATRAEYGLLAPVLKGLKEYENVCVHIELVVTGTHLSNDYGATINEIIDDGFRIDHRIEVPVKSESEVDISQNQAVTLIEFTKLFSKKRYSAIILLGDRYEMLAVAIAAGNTRIPIFHLCGGDATEGALDEWIRHSITKISYLHFVSNEASRRRVIQLGEDPSRVFNYGSTSIDNILHEADLSKKDVLKKIGMNECRYAVCTFHPVTMEDTKADKELKPILEAIQNFPDINFIFTKSNADIGGARINRLLDEAEKRIDNLYVFTSLGVKNYLSLVKSSEFVLGNSSSGIIEAPALHIPTVNIGDRQRGRLKSDSVVNCNDKKNDIINAINIALSKEHRELCRRAANPYGDGEAGKKIAKKVIEIVNGRSINLKKSFYDMQEE